MTLLALIMVYKYVPNKKSSNKSKVSTLSLLKNCDYLLALLIFGLVAFVQFGFRMVMALWIKLSPNSQGLGWTSEADVGYVNSMGGVILIFFPLFGTPYLTKAFGIRQTCMIVILLMVPITLIMPQLWVTHGVLLWTLLAFQIGCFISFTTVFTSVISIAITNSVSSDLVGRAMGLCQSFVALFRALANFVIGYLFGISISWDLAYPLDTHFLFYLCGGILGIAYCMTKYGFDKGIEQRKIETTGKLQKSLLDKQNNLSQR